MLDFYRNGSGLNPINYCFEMMAPIAQLDLVKHSSVLGGSALNSKELEFILRAIYLVQIFDHFFVTHASTVLVYLT